ncbi:histidinol-phosphatase HisJ family protein [Candidatus Peregrinibacteria bacterium]|nr:histidinol-phosphatase HisJ family protein [Candidatus Peregrinibacteria bacterium]
MINLHMHSTFSDGKNTIFEMCEAAEKAKLKIISFTEHCVIGNNTPFYWRMNNRRIGAYCREVERAQDNFKLKVLCGLEIEYIKGKERLIEKTAEKYPLDFVLGAAHLLNGVHVYAQNSKPLYDKYGTRGVFERYFDNAVLAIESGLFDSFAHLDIVRRYTDEMMNTPVKLSMYKDKIEELIDALKTNKHAFELNMSYMYKKTMYPNMKILKLCYGAGLRDVTYGGDSHNVGKVNKRIDYGLKILKDIGFKKVCYFEKRKKKKITI